MAIKTFSDTPFVAQLSDANKVAVVERDGDVICKSAGWVLRLTTLLSFFWGCYLAYLVWSSLHVPPTAPKSAHMPLFLIVFMAVLGLASWLSFFRILLGTARFEVSGATGDFSFFRRRTREPWEKIPAAQISHFAIEKQFYTYKQHSTENAVLILVTTSGERRVLCGSPDEAVIKSLASRLEQLTEKKVEGSAGQ